MAVSAALQREHDNILRLAVALMQVKHELSMLGVYPGKAVLELPADDYLAIASLTTLLGARLPDPFGDFELGGVIIRNADLPAEPAERWYMGIQL